MAGPARCRWCGSRSLEALLPHLAGVVVEFVQQSATEIVLHAHARAAGAACPHCSRPSGRVHGRYVRRLADAAIGGRAVVIELLVRRFRCLNGTCSAVTFAEQVEGLTSPHARRTRCCGRSCCPSPARSPVGPVPAWPPCWASMSKRTPC
ncbi:transposase family protein [Streptomyces sp. NPDC050743]|uniref:transposase family protein n=1 Tax=Streptomyces sp. NPDC050743 TaxID=3365634 RepID=UPI0037B48C39